MARPKKQTVEYFSHDCDHGKTLFVLETQFGNDGYAFWFKLLECLGKSEGHYYDFNDITSRVFLLAKTRLSEDNARNILSMLSDMEAIDRELWENGIIWCQNFVDRLTDVYTRRKVEKPLRPTLTINERDKCQHKPLDNGQSDNINPQSKVKESKVKKESKKKNKTPLPSDFKISDRVKEWAKTKGKNHLDDHLEAFKAKCLANDYAYADWDAAFMEAIRANWAKIDNGNGSGGKPREDNNPFTVCPKCHKEVLKADREGEGCVHCMIGSDVAGMIGNIMAGIGR